MHDGNDFNEIEKYRYELLNLQYTLQEKLPVKEMGKAAIISFFSHASHSLCTSLVDNVPVCEVHFSEQECFQFVAEPDCKHLDFLKTDLIMIDNDTLYAIDNPVSIAPTESEGLLVEMTDILEDEDDVKDEERREDNECRTVELLVTAEEVEQRDDGYHREIRCIAQMHQFAEHRV